MKTQFAYIATKDGEQADGYITAASEDAARKTLTDLGYSVSDIKEAKIGRSNPFEPYNKTTGANSTENLEKTEE